MADTRISNLAAETAAPGDEIPVNRGGVNYKITAGDILKQDSGTLTADAPALDLTQTWNAGGVTFTGLKFNVPTDSSASGSLLMDLQVGGTSKFSVSKTGQVSLKSNIFANDVFVGASSAASDRIFSFRNNSTIGFVVYNDLPFKLAKDNGGNTAAWLRCDAADTFAQRNGANAQTLRIYNTYTDASNYERLQLTWSGNVAYINTTASGTGGGRELVIRTDSTNNLTFGTNATARWFISGSGGHLLASADNTYDIGASGATRPRNIYVANQIIASGSITGVNFVAGSTSYFRFTSRTVLWSPADGDLFLESGAGGSFGKLQFGGTTSSFPALKRSSTSLIVRLADDSANAPLESASLKTDAPAGGTAATWKLGAVATVSPTSPNRTIEVDIGGTIYYLHAKTTND